MDECIFAIVEFVLVGRSSQIPLFAEEDLHVLIDQHPHSYVKLPPVYQKRSLYVLLDDETQILWDIHRSVFGFELLRSRSLFRLAHRRCDFARA